MSLSEMKKKPVSLLEQMWYFQWNPASAAENPESSPLKFYSNSRGEIPISDFRRTSILRKPLFI
jgi:hypothetical protein